MIAQIIVLSLALAFGFAPELAGYTGTFNAIVAHLAGPLIAALAAAAVAPSLAFLRYVNIVFGLLLTLSPIAELIIETHVNPTALVLQTIVGLWIMAFSNMGQPLYKTAGWRRAIKAIDETEMKWN